MMKIEILFSYMEECKMYNCEPTWEGLKIFHMEIKNKKAS